MVINCAYHIQQMCSIGCCDFSSASWLPCWNGVLEWPCCAWSDGSTGSCMTLPVMDQVALGETFEGSSGLSQSSEFSWGQKDQLKATGLLALISYLIAALPQVYTPANRPDIRISSFVQARGFGPPQGLEVCVSACRRWAKVSIIWLVFPNAPHQLVRMRNRPRRGEGSNTCPAQQADVLWGSLWVASRERGTDWCKTYTCFAHCHVRRLSPVAPWALSYLLFLSRLLANCDICSEMKA